MKTIKTLLAVIMAVCLMMSLATATFATAAEGSAPEAGNETPVASSTPTTEAAQEPSTPVEDAEEPSAPVEDAEDAEDEHAGHDHSTETTGTTEESPARKTIRVILTVLEVLASLALGSIILMQSGKEAGLSGAISGNSESYMSKGGNAGLDKLLAKSTKWVALVWLLLTLSLSLI